MFTDVANGINLYYGPDPNATVNQTEVDDGRIKKAHPVWGVLMLTIPFLPMMVFVPIAAIACIDEAVSRTKIVLVLLPLSLVFTAIATPCYVLFVLGVGISRVIGCGCVSEDSKETQGQLKTLEISLESAIQTCLGEYNHLLLYNPLSSQASTSSSCLASTPTQWRSPCSWAAYSSPYCHSQKGRRSTKLHICLPRRALLSKHSRVCFSSSRTPW